MLSVDSGAYCRRIGADRYDYEALQRYELLRASEKDALAKALSQGGCNVPREAWLN